MEPSSRIAFLACTSTVLLAAACGPRHAAERNERPSKIAALATPTIARQVALAERSGPGFLDYCGTKRGKHPAQYDLGIPGSPRAGGWCVTAWLREPHSDIIWFRTHWDATPYLHRSGTQTWRFRVNRPAQPTATRVAILTRSSGPPPP